MPSRPSMCRPTTPPITKCSRSSGAPTASLAPLGRFATGGRGTGKPHLPSQSSIVLSDDGRRLLVVNAGSDELSLFAVENDGLRLADRVASGGATPTSVAVSGNLVYVLNNGTPNIAGFRIDDGRLVELEGSARPLSAEDADPAQVVVQPRRPDPRGDRARDRLDQRVRHRRARPTPRARRRSGRRARRRTGSTSPRTAR